jgi:hypothetical protein
MADKTVPRIGRILDVVGLLLFLVGAGCFTWAWIGFGDVPAFVPDPDGEPWAAVRMANGYLRLQKTGGSLMFVGILVFVAAWWMARQSSRAESKPVT